ncbi:thiopeptide-type bacteriocin biosynthesis protein [Chryseobacterium gregarium]|uniref:thiopeptide-type bacteriocin biosynthesis protein n=1 Tax=Chryseobacterium gregarium TaxID=456299 RepID=UPI000480467C|nr:thiopeptide-type bacteriocin biosynthesis protein [Chryseobacterium gregarium]
MKERLNIIGGEWIYYKIYLGSKTADNFLSNEIKSLVDYLTANDVIEKWFFIRYNDPQPHLRIRYKCNSSQLPVVINMMYNILYPLVQNHTIWKVQNETYNREIERYGLHTIELAELFFNYDSNMVIDFFSKYKNDDEKRWLFALKAIDHHLNLFKYSLLEKRDLLERLSISFKSEFSNSKELNTGLNNKFRENKKKIADFIDSNDENMDVINILTVKNKNLSDTADDIMKILADDTSLNMNSFNASLIHMMLNRIFKSKNRMNEFVCYDFLFRYYNSKIAMEKYNAL